MMDIGVPEAVGGGGALVGGLIYVLKRLNAINITIGPGKDKAFKLGIDKCPDPACGEQVKRIPRIVEKIEGVEVRTDRIETKLDKVGEDMSYIRGAMDAKWGKHET